MSEPTHSSDFGAVYIVDLNEVYEGKYCLISERHLWDGSPILTHFKVTAGDVAADYVPPPQVGALVRVYSDDEDITWDARVVKNLDNGDHAVEVIWGSGSRILVNGAAMPARTWGRYTRDGK